MATDTKRRSARGIASLGFLGLARVLALVWMGPALIFNVDWTGHGSWQANSAAVIMILGSALFIEGALRFRSLVLTPLCVLAALFLVYANTKAAVRNLSFASEAASEAKQAKIDAGSQLASQRSQLESRRQAQVQLAGEQAVGVHEAALAQVIASDATQWRVSRSCEAPNGPITGAFCTQVAAAKAKVEAAKKRDEIDADLRALPVAPVDQGQVVIVPAVADSYVANIKAMAGELGYKPSDRIIKAEEAMSRALAFELLAALGPTCWLAFVDVLFGIGAAMSAQSTRSRNTSSKREKIDTSEAKDAPKATADDIERWIADDLEEAPASESMRSSDMRKLALAWFATRGLPKPVESELWAKVRLHFKHDPNNGRPRYLGVRARAKSAGPQLVVNNS